MDTKVKYICLVLLCLFILTGNNKIVAQGTAVVVNVFEELSEVNGTEVKKVQIPAENVRIRVCDSEVEAKREIALYKQKQDDGRLLNGKNVGVTNSEGFTQLKNVPPGGALIYNTSEGTIGHVLVSGRKEIRIVFKNTGSRYSGANIVGKKQRPKPNPPITPEVCGNYLSFTYEFLISGTQARTNGRAVLAPIAFVETLHDTAKIMRPAVLDGAEYTTTMLRHMAYDMNNDKLYAYLDSTRQMTTLQDDIIYYSDVLYPIDENKIYPVYGYLWIEDYNGVYHKDTVLLSEGYFPRPMRFLDFSIPDVRIDTTQFGYRREGKAERQSSSYSLNLQFEVGKKELNLNDSVTVTLLQTLMETLSKYYNRDGQGDASITGIGIHGYASPEGRYDGNKSLSLERSRYVFQYLSDHGFSGLRAVNIDIQGDVIPWTDVAEALRQRHLDSYADGITEIVTTYPNSMDAQYNKIRQQPYFNFVKDSILPSLRKVDFSFEYETYRVRTTDEIRQLYETREDYRTGVACKDYELYQLFRMFENDHKRLEPLAAVGTKSFQDLRDNRPWPLAAYYLALCKIDKGIIDTTLLKPYIDTTEYRVSYRRQQNGIMYGVYNDPAIIIAHISMLCQGKEYKKALEYARLLPPDDPRFARLIAMLNGLNCRFREDDIRDAIAATSLWNKVVVYAAQDEEEYKEVALALIRDSFPLDDPKARYLEATVRWQLSEDKSNTFGGDNAAFGPTKLRYVPDAEYMEDNDWDGQQRSKETWGYPMMVAIHLDSTYMKMMLRDGFFTKKYKNTFRNNWDKLKSQISDWLEQEIEERRERLNIAGKTDEEPDSDDEESETAGDDEETQVESSNE
ncbi:MAG: hypothetical protein J5486_00735 [Bacteroidaceae bacterium]|nr:hypothetical protein [Bacteroidaceae bacterium]